MAISVALPDVRLSNRREGLIVRAARLGFLLAALAGIKALMPQIGDVATHQADLIFGFFGIQIFAFLTHSLPRWIGHRLRPAVLPHGVLALHAAALLWSLRDPESAAIVRTVALLAGAVFLLVPALRSRLANAILPAMLVLIHAMAALLSAAPIVSPVDPLHLGLAALILFCLDVSTRIVLALNAVARDRLGLPAIAPPPAMLTLAMKASCFLTMALWVGSGPVALFALASGTLGLLWLLCLRPWATVRVVGMAALFLGLATMRVGSLLLAASAVGITGVTSSLAIHVWAVGGLAPLAIAISGSIARRQARRAFAASPLAVIAAIAILLAMLARILAIVLPEYQTVLWDTARVLWTLAFAASFLFIATSPDLRGEQVV
jgi:uncharacterized protein involved in response to NO